MVNGEEFVFDGEILKEYRGNQSEVIIPEGVRQIGNSAFFFEPKINSIIIPNSVTKIDINAFKLCENLTTLTIGKGLKEIDNCAVLYCENLSNINISPQNTKFFTSGNCLIERENKTLILGCKNSIIPEDGSVTIIGENSFIDYVNFTFDALRTKNFKYEKEVKTLPESIIRIEKAAFSHCLALNKIIIPNNVTQIGAYAFHYCSNLTNIKLSDALTVIEEGLFTMSGLVRITIPKGVKIIKRIAFYSCYSLKEVILPDTITEIETSAFSFCVDLSSIIFKGTKAQWQQIKKEKDWNFGIIRYTIYCSDGEIYKR